MKYNEIYHTTDSIKYKIVYGKIKNTYIQIKDGVVTVKAPKSASINYIENIVNSKKSWIIKKMQEQTNTPISFVLSKTDI